MSYLGAIIGIGIVAKNGILMLDRVEHLRADRLPLDEALVQSGRRLRPVLMTSLAAALGMLPLAYGIGSGADMLKPLAIGVMGALAISVLLSLVATPAVYYVLLRTLGGVPCPSEAPGPCHPIRTAPYLQDRERRCPSRRAGGKRAACFDRVGDRLPTRTGRAADRNRPARAARVAAR